MTGSLFMLNESRQSTLNSAVEALFKSPFASCLFFNEEEVALMRNEVLALPFRQAHSNVGKGVYQDFDVCFPAPRISSLDEVASMLEDGLNQVGRVLTSPKPLFDSEIKFTDIAAQHYPAQSRGIGIHKDGLRYRNVVVIITLAGTSSLYVCDDRKGAGRQIIDDKPGRLVMLVAPGFSGLPSSDDRPLHGVDEIKEARLSIGLRCEQTASSSHQST